MGMTRHAQANIIRVSAVVLAAVILAGFAYWGRSTRPDPKVVTRTVTVTSIVATEQAPQSCIDAINELGHTLVVVGEELSRLNGRAVTNSGSADPSDTYLAWLRDLTQSTKTITAAVPHSTNIADCRAAR